jgi:hypothetical protein
MQALESRLVDGRVDFQEAVLELVARTRRTLRLVDRDLADWALERPAVIAGIERILETPGASVQVVVARTDFLEREAPRLTTVRRRYADRFFVRVAPAASPPTEGLLLGDASHVLRRASPDAWRGRIELASPMAAEPWLRKFAALWGECEIELPLTTLGL